MEELPYTLGLRFEGSVEPNLIEGQCMDWCVGPGFHNKKIMKYYWNPVLGQLNISGK